MITDINFEIECTPEVLETMKSELDQVISFLNNNGEISEETIGLIEALQDQLND